MHAGGVPARGRSKKPYHHGDLRAELLDAAIELIAERGLAGLSLRECARRAGVSHAAPYRHFADKNALLFAIAEQGFIRLAERGQAAMAGDAPLREKLDAYGIAYVRFAFENPVHHRVMFTAEFPIDAGLADPGARAFELLVEAASGVAGTDVEPEVAALAAWSLSHGLSMLILDARVPAEHIQSPDQVEALARTIFSLWRNELG